MLVHELMNRPVVTCSITESMNEAAQRMWERDCGVLPVVDESLKVVGILTDRDICMAAFTQGRPLAEISVGVGMAHDVVYCREADELQEAERAMKSHMVRRLPVLDAEGRAVGMISMNDLVRFAQSRPRRSMDREVVESLASISAPRAALQVAPTN
ncbi:MAG: CBS domain-containing protein [Deltaproteobacteria bacterium]|nr:CBS domain-containing protein [Deltaproteobacteria bacterium]